MSPPTKGLSTKTTPVKLKPFDAEEDEPEEEGAVGGQAAAPEEVGITELVDREAVVGGGRGGAAGGGKGLLEEDGAKETTGDDKQAEATSGSEIDLVNLWLSDFFQCFPW